MGGGSVILVRFQTIGTEILGKRPWMVPDRLVG